MATVEQIVTAGERHSGSIGRIPGNAHGIAVFEADDGRGVTVKYDNPAELYQMWADVYGEETAQSNWKDYLNYGKDNPSNCT